MAISGSSASSIRLRLVSGALLEGQVINRGADVVEEDPQRAVERLRNGDVVNLWLHGHNLVKVRAAFELPSPLEVLGWTSDVE